MKLFVAATLSLASVALAQTQGFAWITDLIPAPVAEVFAGQYYNLTWESSVHIGEKMTFHLLKGPDSDNLKEIGTIAAQVVNARNGTYRWWVGNALGDCHNVYGLNITLDKNPDHVFRYSNNFTISNVCMDPAGCCL